MTSNNIMAHETLLISYDKVYIILLKLTFLGGNIFCSKMFNKNCVPPSHTVYTQKLKTLFN